MVISLFSLRPRALAGPPPAGLAMLPFVLGLTVGLVIAAAVALYVTRAPVPFVDRGIQRAQPPMGANGLPSEPAAAPGSTAGSSASPRGAAHTPAPATASSPAAAGGVATPGASAGATGAVGTAPTPPASAAGPVTQPPVVASANQFFLQVAAFKSSEEADQMRARLAFMGYEAQISETKKDSLVFYRVRLGPYRSFEELNRAKTSLSDNGLESTVVRSSQ